MQAQNPLPVEGNTLWLFEWLSCVEQGNSALLCKESLYARATPNGPPDDDVPGRHHLRAPSETPSALVLTSYSSRPTCSQLVATQAPTCPKTLDTQKRKQQTASPAQAAAAVAVLVAKQQGLRETPSIRWAAGALVFFVRFSGSDSGRTVRVANRGAWDRFKGSDPLPFGETRNPPGGIGTFALSASSEARGCRALTVTLAMAPLQPTSRALV